MVNMKGLGYAGVTIAVFSCLVLAKHDIALVNNIYHWLQNNWWVTVLLIMSCLSGLFLGYQWGNAANRRQKLKPVQGELQGEQLLLNTLFNNALSPVFVFEHDGRCVDANRAALEFLGCEKQELLAGSYNDLLLPAGFKLYMLQQENLADLEPVEIDYPAGGKVKTMLLNIIPVKLTEKNVYYVFGQEITHYKNQLEQLRSLSLHDPVTGLYNRTYFEQEMRRMEAGRNVSAGIILCDLDGLKLINDTLGHDQGDTLIIVAADILKNCFRGDDMVARIGGDEFAILLPNGDIEVVERASRRIKAAVAKHNTANPDLPLSISIGFAARRGASKKMIDLYKEADNNMYREKLHHSQHARGTIVQTLLATMKAKDFATTEQMTRFKELVSLFAVSVGLPESSVAGLKMLAQFCDIGKVGLPEDIIFKPGPLNPDEMAQMRRHCEIGHRLALSTPDLMPIADWILKHHEWWDGTGYPLGLKGKEIPVECRILSIACAYNAMVSYRPYRKTLSHEQACAELEKYAGIQFDPQLVTCFIEFLEAGAKKNLQIKKNTQPLPQL
ncbi:PAS domain S-box-containing protein/diguanylate cyclase (GGDEF)-like protein [Desulfallas thermosapovorans DSM 6562]|uniref:PAS domain S-box-containing protein/diguanylate cyclase (GGDEF)-like protein n=2 Tax=Desulfallas thermosapovorans TaxID=58137 RepID=A0A5S4ZWF0_9FIRM|nr:PAS domain S-box-containing protein/diguanylate cyclase (GGDEF)-like protein [Desulfallas thermosapovorans DSM 6562]